MCVVIFRTFYSQWHRGMLWPMKIGVMGAEGSFSEKAAQQYMAENKLENAEISYLITAEGVLSALSKGEVDKGVFPIENSNGGLVMEAMDAVAKYSFAIETMFEIDVHLHLLVKPGITSSHIKTICSQDQALKQCRMYVKRVWPNIEVELYDDTATAAKHLAEGALPDTTAVVAPPMSADLYGLDILEASIQDLKFNYTTFVVANPL